MQLEWWIQRQPNDLKALKKLNYSLNDYQNMNTSLAHIPACIWLRVRVCSLWKYETDKFPRGRVGLAITRAHISWFYVPISNLPSLEDLCAHAGPSCPYADLEYLYKWSLCRVVIFPWTIILFHTCMKIQPISHPFYISYIVVLAAAFRKSNVHTKREISTRLPSF